MGRTSLGTSRILSLVWVWDHLWVHGSHSIIIWLMVDTPGTRQSHANSRGGCVWQVAIMLTSILVNKD